MKNSFKKLLSILLCAALLFGAAPLNGFVGLRLPKLNLPKFSSLFAVEAQAASGTCGSNLTWNYNTSTKTLTIRGTGAMNSYGIDYYNGTYVTDAPWKPYYNTMQTLVINSGVTSIGYEAFSGCAGLTSVTIPDSVTSIGSYAFSYCTGLTSVTIPDSVTSIGWSAFENCTGLTSVTIPDSVTSIGRYAFYNTAYYKNSANWENNVLYIGNHLIKAKESVSGAYEIKPGTKCIGYYAFYGCTGLTAITVSADNPSYSSDSFGVLYNKNKTELIQYPVGNTRTSFTIPDSVTSLGSGAFSHCTGLTSVTIGNSVTRIGNDAFDYCKGLTSVTIGNSVKSIGDRAFYNCTGLTSVTIGNSVTSIGNYAFRRCTGLTSVTIGNSVKSIGWSAFEGCTGLKDVYYTGTQEQWNRISIDIDNDPLTNATLHVHVHTYDGVVTQQPTCTAEGVMTYTCASCGDSYAEIIAKLPHTPKTVTVPATCTEPGVQYDACEVCGEKLTADTVLPATGHAYSSVVTKAPNCLEDGVRTYICAACGDSYTEPVPSDPDAHTPSDWLVLRQPVACTSTGLRVKMCTGCGKTLEMEEIPIPHAFSEWIVTTPVTCTEEGEATRTCADCGAEETRPIAALGHDYVETVIAPTCVEPGFTTHVCSRCGNSYATDPVSATGHVYSEWMMFVDPTLTTDGVMGRKCTVCGTVLDEMPVPKLAGDHVTGITLSAEKAYLNRGETLTLTAAVTPESAQNKALIWSSTAPTVATVENGVVTAVAPGTAVIVAAAEDSGDKDFCVIQINAVSAQNGSLIDNGVITGLSVNLNSLADYLNLVDESMAIDYSADVIGTGTKVYVKQGDTVINEFETVIFGDVDGNSWYDGTDAYFVSLVANGLIPASALTEAQRMAADCNHDGNIDSFDVALLEQAGLLLNQIDQSAPIEELQTNSAYLTYCGLIDQSIEVIEVDQPVEEQPTADDPAPAASSLFSRIMAVFTVILNWLLRIF